MTADMLQSACSQGQMPQRNICLVAYKFRSLLSQSVALGLLLWLSPLACALRMCASSPHPCCLVALQLLEAEKARVKRDFERREGTVEVKKKVSI